MSAPVLNISNLSVNYSTDRGTLHALRDVDLHIQAGRIVGIVGESGCGKSTLISTIIRLLSANACVEEGEVLFQGEDLLALDAKAMRKLRGNELAMVFQDPMTSLNPVLSIGRQMLDIQYRDDGSKAEKKSRSLHMLERVGIPDAATQLDRYPHHLSGGMRQRVAIAMALMTEPSLLIADEPTTALDATLEIQIIQRLRQLQRDVGCAVLFISHHLGVISELCDEVVVMYAGEVVESGGTRQVFDAPKHPYTRGLLECDPASIQASDNILPVIPGQLPDLTDPPPGCIFQPRCDRSVAQCSSQRPRLDGQGHRAACFVATS